MRSRVSELLRDLNTGLGGRQCPRQMITVAQLGQRLEAWKRWVRQLRRQGREKSLSLSLIQVCQITRLRLACQRLTTCQASLATLLVWHLISHPTRPVLARSIQVPVMLIRLKFQI